MTRSRAGTVELPSRTWGDARVAKGIPMVLLHGFPLDSRMWSDVAGALPVTRRLTAPDLPGCGRARDLLPSPPTIEAAADAVAWTLRAQGIDRAVVGGLSMGGYVVLALAERHPELVAGIALLDTKSTADTPEARAGRLRVATLVEDACSVAEVRPMSTSLLGDHSRATRPDLADQLAVWINEQEPRGVAWCQRAMASRPDRTAVLRTCAEPAVVVVGTEDTITPVSEAERMVVALAHGAFVRVPRAGHLSAVEQPVQVAEALEALAREVDSQAG